MKKLLPLTIYLLLSTIFYTYSQKGATKPTNPNLPFRSSPSCPLAVSIQDNIPAAVCSELLKTLVAVTGSCTDTTAVSYRWSSSIGGVFSTSRTTTFNLPEFISNTTVVFNVLVIEGIDTVSANYSINIKPRPNSPSLTPFGTIILCDNNPVTLTSSACTGGSTTVWSNGVSGVSSISVPAIGRTYYSVACYKNGCISDSTAAAAFITGVATTPPTTISRTICEGTPITAGSGLQAQLVNCGNIGASGTYTYAGPTVGYDDGFRNNGGIDPSVIIPAGIGLVSKVKISITWRKQKGGFQNDCGVGDTQTWPYHNETQFRIKSPSGRTINLVYTGSYGGSDNPTVTTTFEDGMSPINYYSPPVSGTFSPAQPLSGFIGEDAAGTWTLLPYDAVWKDPLCVSGFAVTLVPNTQNGTVTWWDAPTGGNQLGSGTEFIPTVTAAGTHTYYAQGQCTLGCPSVRTATTLLIKPTPPVPTTSINIPLVNGVRSICYGESVTITATGCSNGGTVDWIDDFTAPDQLGSGSITGDTYTFIPVGGNVYSTTHTIKATCTGTNQCRSAFSSVISYTVKAKPSPPTISGSGTSACLNSVVTLTASSTYGGTFGWTGNRVGNPISFTLTSNTNIKVANTRNGCTGDSSSVYSISTLPKPNKLTVNASQVQALCYGSSVTLTASACVGTIKWTGNLSGSPLTVTPLSSKDYKASCLSSNGCSSDSSTALNIIVLPKTKPVITGNSFVCGSTFNTLTATGCSGVNETVVWRNDSVGTHYSETITQTKTFRAVCIRNGYCVSDSSDIFTVQYRIKPSQPTITPPQNTTICQGTSVSLTATACVGGTSNWTGELTGQTISVSPNANKSYKVACVINGCVSDSSLAVGLIVNPSPQISISSNKTSICSGDSAFLTVTGCTGTISWSNGATTSVIKVSPTSNTTYTSVCTLGSCSATQSLSITLLSTPYVTTSGLLQCGQTVTLTANNVPVGSSIQWRKDGVDIVNAANSTFVINSAGSYDFTSYKVESPIFVGNSSFNESVKFINETTGFVGNNEGIFKTNDGGVTWIKVYNSSKSVKCISFINSLVGWAVGNQGLVIKTIDGGNNWTLGPITTIYALYKVVFKDSNNGLIVGDFGSIFTTSNGGNTWIAISTFNIALYPTFTSTIFVPNTLNIWAVGAQHPNGFIVKSIDNGLNWSQVSVPVFVNKGFGVSAKLNDIVFTTSNNGWVVADDGLYRTTDGGTTWQIQSTGVTGVLAAIQFVSNQVGFIVGNNNTTLLKTVDSGNTWRSLNTSAYANSLSFISDKLGWMTYNSTIVKYVVPQCSATPKVIAPPERQNPPTITQPTNSTICQGSNITLSATGCTGGTFAWTGGLTGTSISVSPSATKVYKVACTLNSCVSDSSSAVTITVTPSPIISLVSNKTSICLGDSAFLTVSGCTGSISWSNGATASVIKVSPIVNTTYTATCVGISCSSTQSVSIIALSTPSVTASGLLQCGGQAITLTSNNIPAGSNIQWRKDGVDIVGATNNTLLVNTAGSYDFTSYIQQLTTAIGQSYNTAQTVAFLNKNIGLMSTPYGIYKTIDGGTSWTQVYNSYPIKSIQFVNSTTVWAVGDTGSSLKSTNAGDTWESVFISSSAPFKKVVFKDINNGIIVGDFGEIFTTSNGGNTWISSPSFSGGSASPQILGVAYVPNTSNIWIVGKMGNSSSAFVATSSNNGTTWTGIPVQVNASASILRDVTFTSQNNGFIVGNDGKVLKTTDAGISWQLIITPVSNTYTFLTDIEFVNTQIGYIIGTNTRNHFLETKDGGNTWTSKILFENSSYNSYSISFPDESLGFITHENRLIKYSNPQCPTIPKVIPNNCCNGLETIKSGSWTDPTTWSCNKVPTAADDIFINSGHIITDSGNTIHAKTLNYRGGILQLSISTNFILR